MGKKRQGSGPVQLKLLCPGKEVHHRGGDCRSSGMGLWRKNEAGSFKTSNPLGDLQPFALSAENET